jgi:signal transduction histidine kinase
VRLILAVDDENSGLYFRRLMLEHAGYKVLSATGVDDALQVFANNPIDLVVTDHLLGRQVGTEMSREMKVLKPSVAIILLSGTTSVRESCDWMDINRKGIRVSICDDACGIPKDVQSNLFHPFFTTKGRDGTGVGLWVSRGVIAKHDGSIQVRSRTGAVHGTCFSVFLPQ